MSESPVDSTEEDSDPSSDSDGTESSEDEDGEEAHISQDLHGYKLIDVDILNRNILSQLSYAFCHSKVNLSENERKGLESKFAFMCQNKNCDRQQAFSSCPIIPVGNVSVYSVNRCSAFAMRCISGDLAELQTFCGVMDLPKPVSKVSFNKMDKTMNKAACSVQKQSMEDAAVIEHCLAEDIGDVRDIEISVDGTYMTRRH